MNVVVEIDEQEFTVDLDRGLSLARPLDFESQFAEFGVDPPSREPLSRGSFIGDTKQGGGCNVDRLSLIPHCHGTHTETVGHIVDDRLTIAEMKMPSWMLCGVISVTPQLAETTDEQYTPAPSAGDLLIAESSLASAFHELSVDSGERYVKAFHAQRARALVVHCRTTARSELPPYFSTDGICWCNRLNVDHLLVDSPSIDRLEDDGLLTNHHVYWNVPPGSHALATDSWSHKTITELITVEPQIVDGFYLLNLQSPAFCLDAAPSRPVIFPLNVAR